MLPKRKCDGIILHPCNTNTWEADEGGGHQFKYSPATQGDSVFHKKIELNVVGHTVNHSTWDAEADRILWAQI